MRRGAVIAVLLALIPIASIADRRGASGGRRGEMDDLDDSESSRRDSPVVQRGDVHEYEPLHRGRRHPEPDLVDNVLIEQWDGHRWTLMAGRNKPNDILYDVTCTVPTNCFAVGFFYALHALNKALIEQWDGKHWTLMPTPKISGSTATSLSGVACVLFNSCFAVGSFSAQGHGIAP